MILAPPSGRRPWADAPPAPPRYATVLTCVIVKRICISILIKLGLVDQSKRTQ